MKALLVIDIPSSCEECPLNSHTEYDFDVCWVTQGKGGCPLKPLPQKREIDIEVDLSCGDGYESGYKDGYNRGVNIGFNQCLKEIQNDN